MTRRGLVRGWTLALITGLLSTFGATFAEAQRFGRPATPGAGACFYRDANFQGDYFCVRAGEAIESLPPDMNDQISSIRTFGREVGVIVFQNRNFGGRSARFGDIRNLRNEGWNDRLSSLRVEGIPAGGGFGNFSGNPDRIVRRAYEDILNREPDEAGLRLYRSRIIDDGWTEQQVREALRTSPEYRTRTTMTRQRATEIVRQAYLSVFNREPDAGSQGYVDHVMRDGWTQDDVVRELRRSPEYRARGR
jgi:hypothetical protein